MVGARNCTSTRWRRFFLCLRGKAYTGQPCCWRRDGDGGAGGKTEMFVVVAQLLGGMVMTEVMIGVCKGIVTMM